MNGDSMRLEPKPAPSLAVTLLYPVAAIVLDARHHVAAGARRRRLALLGLLPRLARRGRLAIRAARDADPRDAADLHRPRRRRRLPRQALEHRRGGAALYRRRRDRAARHRRAAAARRPAHPAHHDRRHGRRRASSARPGRAEDPLRRRRGGHDAAPQLHRAALRLDAARRAAEGPDGPRLAAIAEGHRRGAAAAHHPGQAAALRLRPRARLGGRRLGDHEEDRARLRDARRRPQSAGGALRRHPGQRGADEDSAAVRRARRARRLLRGRPG